MHVYTHIYFTKLSITTNMTEFMKRILHGIQFFNFKEVYLKKFRLITLIWE